MMDWSPALRRHFHQDSKGMWNEANRANGMEVAAGLSYGSRTGQVFLRAADMGWLDFPSEQSREAWARAWTGFQYIGLGPPVDDEALRRAEPVRSTILGYKTNGEPTQVAEEVDTWFSAEAV